MRQRNRSYVSSGNRRHLYANDGPLHMRNPARVAQPGHLIQDFIFIFWKYNPIAQSCFSGRRIRRAMQIAWACAE
jgi:hypothetical protein